MTDMTCYLGIEDYQSHAQLSNLILLPMPSIHPTKTR